MTQPCDLVGPYAYDPHVLVLWVEVISDVQAPTDDELALGVDLQALYDLTDIIGWEVDTDIIRDGKWGPFEEQRMGGQKVDDSRLMFAADLSGNDVRTLWTTQGQAGNIVILPSGSHLDYPAAPMNVYPVRVAQLTQQQRLRSGGASQILVTFTVTARVGENVLAVF